MATILLRSSLNRGLTNAEVDANFTALNDDLANKVNQAGARAAISVSGSLAYDANTGVISYTSPVTSVAGKTGAVTLTKSDVGLSLVEDKSSSTIRSEITSGNVTGALGFTPPASDGTGASGTWGIGVSGNAATATNLAGGAASQIPYQTGSGTTAFIANGTSGQVLTSNGAGIAPTWQASSGGGGGGGTFTISNKTAAYTVVAGDLGTIINCTSGTFTVTLTAAATLGAGFNCWVWNTGAVSNSITIDPSGTETIDGHSTIVLRGGEGTQIVCTGSNWQTGKTVQTLYSENNDANASRPTVTGDRSVGIGSGSTASGFASFAAGYLNTASNSGTTALGYFSTASGSYSLAIGGNASAQWSTAIGHNSGGNRAQAVTGSGATAVGGSYASGTDSFAAAVADNSSSYGATGASSIAFGYLARATANYSVAIGSKAAAAGLNSLALGGTQWGGPVASGYSAVVIGMNYTLSSPSAYGAGSMALHDGSTTTSNAQNSIAIQGGATTIKGQYAFAGGESGSTAQTSTFILKKLSTNATPVVLTTDRITDPQLPGVANQIVLKLYSVYVFSGLVVARVPAIAGGTASAAWKVDGVIRKENTAAATVLLASTVTALYNPSGWTLALSADTTYGALAVTATGAAATNIRWVATINTNELTYV